MKNKTKKETLIIREHFDRFSNKYRENFFQKKSGKNYEFNTRLKIVSEITKNYSGNLLDCACGSGEITTEVLISGRFETAVLVDLSGAMLMIAKENTMVIPSTTSVFYCQSDIFDYEGESERKFDVILCLGLVAHTGRLASLFLHLKSMLSPRGKIILQSSLLDHVGIKLLKILMPLIPRRKKNYDLAFYRMKDIDVHLRSSGLKVENVVRYNFGFPFGDMVSKSANYWIEILMQGFSSRHGSDAVFVISHND